jgi:hypothetical protein
MGWTLRNNALMYSFCSEGRGDPVSNSAPDLYALLVETWTNTRTHTWYLSEQPQFHICSWMVRKSEKIGLLNQHWMTGVLQISPMPCTTVTSAPSRTYQQEILEKKPMPHSECLMKLVKNCNYRGRRQMTIVTIQRRSLPRRHVYNSTHI